MAQLAANQKLGIIRKLTPAQVSDKRICAVIHPVKFVHSGPLTPSPAAAAAMAGHGPEADRALAAACADEADDIVVALAARLRADPAAVPHEALEAEIASRKTVTKIRVCVNGHEMTKKYLHAAPLSFVTFAKLIAPCTPGAVVGKTDGHAFFYVVEYAEASKRFFCYEYDSDVYVQDRLGMGYGDSCALASALSAVLCEIVVLRTGAACESYMDDVVNVAPFAGSDAATAESAAATQAVVREVMAEANVPEALSKRALGRDVVVLGRVVDTVAGRVRLPRASARKYALHLFVVRRLLESADPRLRAAVTTASVSSLSGKLGWWAESLLRARTHLGGIIKAATSGISLANLSRAVLEDLRWWEKTWSAGALAPEVLLDAAAGVVRLVHVGAGGVDGAEEEESLAAARGGRRPRVVAGDAGDPGGGAVCGREAVYLQWTPEEAVEHSDWRELRVTLEALRRFGPSWAPPPGAPPARVLLLMDNLGNVFSINRGRARRDVVTTLISELYDVAEAHGISFCAAWLPRECNTVPDALSKAATPGEAAAVAARLGLRLI